MLAKQKKAVPQNILTAPNKILYWCKKKHHSVNQKTHGMYHAEPFIKFVVQ